jgi:8-hydroxy-5-deazaflavin:NADPH oxidoreductase
MTDATPIGFLGAGPVAQDLSRRALAARRPVVLSNSRGPQTLAALCEALGERASAATLSEVAKLQIVVLAVPWTVVPEVLKSLPPWEGRILVDATNHFLNYDPPVWDDIGGRIGTEIVSEYATDARVVRAFGSLGVSQYATTPAEGRGRRVMFVSGNDTDANRTVEDLVYQLDFAPIVLGGIEQARLHQLGGPLMEVPFSLLAP